MTRHAQWVPRVLREDDAANYVALSVTAFRIAVAPEVPCIWLTKGRKGYLREDLDAWVDRRAGRAPIPDGSEWLRA